MFIHLSGLWFCTLGSRCWPSRTNVRCFWQRSFCFNNTYISLVFWVWMLHIDNTWLSNWLLVPDGRGLWQPWTQPQWPLRATGDLDSGPGVSQTQEQGCQLRGTSLSLYCFVSSTRNLFLMPRRQCCRSEGWGYASEWYRSLYISVFSNFEKKMFNVLWTDVLSSSKPLHGKKKEEKQ